MDLLPSEFINYAKNAKVSLDKIAHIIGADLMEFIPASEDDVPLRDATPIENWELLETPTHVFCFKKIVRRSLFQTYQLYCDSNNDNLSLIGTSRFNSVLFEAFTSQVDFINTISEKFENYQSIDQDLKSIQNLSSDEFFVIVALLELFIEKYPTPTINWSPNELLVFTKESLLEIISESKTKLEDQTWWQHWKSLTDAPIPAVGDIETAILLLANKGLIGMMDDVEGKEVFFIGQSLVWLLRSLVWWDLGFVLENEENKTQLFVIQASSLFALIVENTQNFSLFNIDGEQLPKLISNFMNYAESPNDTTKVLDKKETPKKTNFCPNCGTAVKTDAKFCANCGQELT